MKLIKNFFKWLAVVVVISIVGFIFWLQGQYVVPILMYHHVKPSSVKELNTVSPESFEWQMKFLSENHYNVIDVDQYYEMKKEGKDFPRNTVLITFDDGYEDNYVYAFPILKKYNFPAAEFIISDLVGDDHLMSWDQIKEMKNNRITIGSHTRHHRYLPNTIGTELKDEIEGSKKILEKNLGQKINYIAYPTGGFTEDVKKISKAVGYLIGFTTNRGTDRSNTDLYEIKRIRMNNKDNRFVLFAKYSGYYNVFRQLKKPYNDDDALGIVYKQ